MNHEFLSPVLNAAKDVEIKVDGVRIAAARIEEVEFAPGRTITVEFTPLKAGNSPSGAPSRRTGSSTVI